MTYDDDTPLIRVLHHLDILTKLKVGDPFPEFMVDRTNNWGTALSNLAGAAAVNLRKYSARVSELLQFNNEFEERARVAERAMKAMLKARPISEYHEDMGPVLWWKFPITEPPYVGTPNDCGITVEAHTNLMTQMNQSEEPVIARFNVGGWPGYHTHWTPLPDPNKVSP